MRLAPRLFTATAISLTGLLLSACASNQTQVADRIAYTDGVESEYRLGDTGKRHLQYYSSHTIRLVRALTDGDKGIRQGRLISDNGQWLQEIVIPRGTPGISVGSGPDWLAISFAPGTYLYFVNRPQNQDWLWTDDAGIEGRYFLYAPEWRGGYGRVQVGNVPFEAVDGSLNAHLLVDRQSLFQMQEDKRVLGGRRLYN